ncbi:MAG: 5'/3'-nucleotidase SurE [Bacilli bacterium]|nr:5'/3'-nucleotidase SurE [Bacilli bacterium]
MNILLTNDDGYFAYGINLLYELLSKEHHVVIVAPKEVMSAKSVSIIVDRPVEINKINDHVFAVGGTPADCVAFGLSSLNIKFDLVVSGCNHGLNVSYDTMYSGTIGACLQALTYRLPAIAVSADCNYDIVEENFLNVFSHIIDNNLLSKEYLLNINFPLSGPIKGIKLTHIYYRKAATYYIHKEGNIYQALRDLDDKNCTDIDSDVYAIYHHYVSISKLGKTLDYNS